MWSQPLNVTITPSPCARVTVSCSLDWKHMEDRGCEYRSISRNRETSFARYRMRVEHVCVNVCACACAQVSGVAKQMAQCEHVLMVLIADLPRMEMISPGFVAPSWMVEPQRRKIRIFFFPTRKNSQVSS